MGHANAATITETIVADVVAELPGAEVVVQIECASTAIGVPTGGSEVHVFAGNSREARRLGQPVVGSIERVSGDIGNAMFSASVSTRVWETLDTDSYCCPSKYVVVERFWSDEDWVEGGREVWEQTVYEQG